MSGKRKCKCLYCNDLFQPDYRNRGRQKYCRKAACKRAGKRASQQKWLHENPDYFRGTSHVNRVRQWRQKNPGYWRNCKNKPKGRLKRRALQDDCNEQTTRGQKDNGDLRVIALQDHCITQPAVIVGLISSLTSYTLQDDIAEYIQNLHKRGNEILEVFSGINNPQPRSNNEETNTEAATHSADTPTFQLGRSPPGQ